MAIKPETGMNAFPARGDSESLAPLPPSLPPVLTILDRATIRYTADSFRVPARSFKEQGNLRPVSARSTFS